jgi:hypothetical protein
MSVAPTPTIITRFDKGLERNGTGPTPLAARALKKSRDDRSPGFVVEVAGACAAGGGKRPVWLAGR